MILRDVVVPADEPVGGEVNRLERGVCVHRGREPHRQRHAALPRGPERQRFRLPQTPRQRVVVGQRVSEEVQGIERRPSSPLRGSGERPAALRGVRVPHRDPTCLVDALLSGTRIVHEHRASPRRLDADEPRQPERPPVALEPRKEAGEGEDRQVDGKDTRPALATVPGDGGLDQCACFAVHEARVPRSGLRGREGASGRGR